MHGNKPDFFHESAGKGLPACKTGTLSSFVGREPVPAAWSVQNGAGRLAALVAGAILAAGCNGIGDGSTIESLRILPVNTSTQTVAYQAGGTYKMYQCLRDELQLVADFTDGTAATFNSRATWVSSNEAVVRVSNGDIPAVFVVDGQFEEHGTVKYARGTVIPTGPVGSAATITASFAGLQTSIQVVIGKPEFTIVPVPSELSDPLGFTGPVPLANGTTQRLTVLGKLDGRVVTIADLAGGSLNGFQVSPFRWHFPGGQFEARDDTVVGDFDKWLVPDASTSNRKLSINTSTGVLSGIAADFTEYPLAAEQSLCPDSTDPVLQPITSAKVVQFANSNPIALEREAGFNAPPFNSEDLVIGTNQVLQVKGNLDTDGDGVADGDAQNLNVQARYTLEPKDTTCDTAGLNCAANSDFFFSFNFLSTAASTTGGSVTEQACFPLCVPTLASLSADVAAGSAPLAVTFTPAAVNPTPGIILQSYTIDFGDSTVPENQTSTTIQHTYAADGQYTATVRVTDSTGAINQNAGAVQIAVGAIPANTAPTARLTASSSSGTAPLTVALNASTSSDADTDDSITVYEFNFGDGTPVVRQSSSSATHVYLIEGEFTPSVIVYDERAAASASVAATAITVTGTAPTLLRSNLLTFNAVDATLCSIALEPLGPVTEQAFTFPGAKFEAIGTFIANTGTDDCAVDTPIGTQKITRFMSWAARPSADSAEFSEFATVRNASDDFQNIGQIRYLQNVTADTNLSITAAPQTPFTDFSAPGAATLTVSPCPSLTCPSPPLPP